MFDFYSVSLRCQYIKNYDNGEIMFFDFLQLLGGIMLSVGQVPQIMQIMRTKSAKDLNLKTYVMMVTGISLMEAYAINLVVHGAGGAFLVTNTISLIASSIMLFLILKYGRNKDFVEK